MSLFKNNPILLRQTVGMLFAAMCVMGTASAQTLETVLTDSSSQPSGIAVDLGKNTYYLLGMATNPVVAYDPESMQLTPIVNTSLGTLISPMSLALWKNGLLIADTGTNRLQYVDIASGVISVPWDFQWVRPSGVAVDVASNVFVVDWNGLSVLTPSNTVNSIYTNLNRASAVAVGESGKVWVADAGNNVVRLLELDGITVTNMVVVGRLGTPGYQDSTVALSAMFNQPRGLLWLGGQTGLLVSDAGNSAIRTIAFNSTRNSWAVSTLLTGVDFPGGLALNDDGKILVASTKAGSLFSITRSTQAAVTMTPSSGSYSNSILIHFSSTNASDPEFHFTMDGTEPTKLTTSASSITVQRGPVEVRARCYSPDLLTSETATNNYAFFVATPESVPAGSTNENAVSVALSSVTEGARLYWTLDGSTPSVTNGHLYAEPFTVGSNSVLKFVGVKEGYSDSDVETNVFSFTVAAPLVTPSGTNAFDGVPVSISCATTNALIYWTIDGTEPGTNSSLYAGPFTLQTNGTLKTRAFRNGFTASDITSAVFSLSVATPVIAPAGATSDNPVFVSLSTATPGAAIYWTIDGTEPTTQNGVLYQGPFWLQDNGSLQAKAFKDGFSESDVVSASFNLAVGPLQVTPDSETTINLNRIQIASSTTNALVRYTLDGSTPSDSNGFMFTNTPGIPFNLEITTNTVLTVAAFHAGFESAATVTKTYQIQVDTPVMTPSGGYYPDGVSVQLSVQRDVSGTSIYYTTNGETPTTNDFLYTGPFTAGYVGVAKGYLGAIQARAFSPNAISSDVVGGTAPSVNTVGIARDITAGMGSTIVLPVTVNMASTQYLSSLQFRVEIVPSLPGTPAMTNWIEAMDISTNDFVPVILETSDGKITGFNWKYYISGVTNGGIYSSIATNLQVSGYGDVLNLKVRIPKNANEGDTYSVYVTGASGTSDAYQGAIPLVAGPTRTLTIRSTQYLAGDCAPGNWYGAGEFGSDSLENADVNAIFKASLGIHAPPSFSDAFNAMDVYPEGGNVIGNGLITFLDWQHALWRATGYETDRWYRWWGPGGVLCHTNLSGVKTVNATPKVDVVQNTNQWLRHVLIAGQPVSQAVPGQSVAIPVFVRVLSGFNLAGFQFLASVDPVGDAPALTQNISFSTVNAVPAPSTSVTPAIGKLGCGWALGAFSEPLVQSNLIGYVAMQIPANAVAGQQYVLRMNFPEGAADADTELTFESAPATVWVLSAPASVQHIVSDDWKTNYFGSVAAPEADSDADPDHDGVPNWQEYLAGTNPLDASSRLAFSSVRLESASPEIITFEWQSVLGRTYVIETSSDLAHGSWSSASESFQGTGGPLHFSQTNSTENVQFFRILVQ